MQSKWFPALSRNARIALVAGIAVFVLILANILRPPAKVREIERELAAFDALGEQIDFTEVGAYELAAQEILVLNKLEM